MHDPLARTNDPRITAVQQQLGHGLFAESPLETPPTSDVPSLHSTVESFNIRPDKLRQTICQNLIDVLHHWGLQDTDQLQVNLLDTLSKISDSALKQLARRAAEPPPEWGYRSGDPVMSALMKPLMERLVLPNSEVKNGHFLNQLGKHPVVFLGNHLSAIDVHTFQHLLNTIGQGEIADNITAVVGYKTFELPLLRQLSLSFGTLKVPQSTSIHTGTVEMKAQDVARFARSVISAAEDRLETGDRLVVFPEGTRSRTAQMLPCLSAVSRYLTNPDLVVIPFAHYGTEKILPVDQLMLVPSTVTLAIGEPVLMSTLIEQSRQQSGNRAHFIMDSIGHSIAQLLPKQYRGHYAA